MVGGLMPLIRVTISAPKEVHERLSAKAEATGLSLSAYMLKKAGEKPLPLGRPWPKKEKRTK